jgi:hypothetical protein
MAGGIKKLFSCFEATGLFLGKKLIQSQFHHQSAPLETVLLPER